METPGPTPRSRQREAPAPAAGLRTSRITPETLDAIRLQVDWRAAFAGLGLKKAERKSKPEDWWAFSPFHDERTPSFHMGPGGLWYDFSIGEGGGVIELVQRLKGCDCFEAGRIILENGWALGAERAASSQTGRAQIETRRRAAQVATPTEAPFNAPIRQDLIKLCAYHPMLEARGLSEETCALLGIGYLPQGRSALRDRIVFQIADARPGKSGALERVILSHLGRAAKEGQDPKYLFYDGFQKSAELYAQERLALDPEAAAQAQASGALLLTEGPFDAAKAIEAGLRNVVASFGTALSEAQALKLQGFARRFGIKRVRLAFDRDDAGRRGAETAAALLRDHGLTPETFDWEAPLAGSNKRIPPQIADLADLSVRQLQWLRAKELL